MAYHTGPKIVTDGLVLCLDAADRNSYPGSGSTWYDLSGNGNNGAFGTSTAAPTFSGDNGGVLSFDGSNDYVIVTSSPTFKTTSNGKFSISAWFNTTGAGGVYPQVVWHDRTMIGVDKLPTQGTLSNEIYTNIGGTVTFSGISAESNQWYNVTITYNNTSTKIYVNGILKKTSTRTLENQATDNMIIGDSSTTGTNPFYGNISNILVYNNKELSADEVRRNYNATKGRFNLLYGDCYILPEITTTLEPTTTTTTTTTVAPPTTTTTTAAPTTTTTTTTTTLDPNKYYCYENLNDPNDRFCGNGAAYAIYTAIGGPYNTEVDCLADCSGATTTTAAPTTTTTTTSSTSPVPTTLPAI